MSNEMSKRMIYLDNAATTKPLPEVVEVVNEFLEDQWGNPGGAYGFGEIAKGILGDCRKTIADTLWTSPDCIYFTSGGSESDNLAIKSVAEEYGPGSHIITSQIEHKAVLNTCKWLESRGYKVTYLPPDERGIISPQQVEDAIRDNTILVSIMMVNNEIGTIEPIKEIGYVCEHHGILFHVDAVQAYSHMKIDVGVMKIDMLSASAHKFHGPKGVGFLYSRVPLHSLIHGGSQEGGVRAGTENMPGIVGMAVAAELAHQRMEENMSTQISLRDRFIENILNSIDNATLNGSLVCRAPNNVNFSFKGINGETALVLLDMRGICASTGSACNSSDGKPSHVLKAIGKTDEEARSSLRFTLSEFTTVDEIDEASSILKETIEQLRSLN